MELDPQAKTPRDELPLVREAKIEHLLPICSPLEGVATAPEREAGFRCETVTVGSAGCPKVGSG